MKTQISNLINGAKSVRRDENHEKYINAAQATSHVGYAGSNSLIRREIAEKVISENPDGMRVQILGNVYYLERKTSVSGKSVWFSCPLQLNDFLLISGYQVCPYKNETSFLLNVNEDMTVCIHMQTRRNEKSQWRYRGSLWIGEEFITIL